MLPVYDDTHLTALLVQQMSEIMNDVSEDLLKLLRAKIKEIVYDPYNPTVYRRLGKNGGFLGSWRDKNQTIGNTIESTIESEPGLMSIDREEYQHGSVYNDDTLYSDVRGVLAEILNEGKAGSLFDYVNPPHWWKTPRPFFDEFIRLLDNGKVDELFEKHFRRNGIKFIRI